MNFETPFDRTLKLRVYLAKQRSAWKDPQRAAWAALDELDCALSLLRRLRKAGMQPELVQELDAFVKRNSPPDIPYADPSGTLRR